MYTAWVNERAAKLYNVRSKIRKVLGVDNTVHWESFKDKRLHS